MKAYVCEQYGGPDVLRLADVEQPSPDTNSVLVQIRSVALNALDWRIMRGKPFPLRFMFGLTKPKFPIIGTDVCGTVVQVGDEVTKFKVGDEVFGDLSRCGFGGWAEYATVPESAIAVKPDSVSYDDAATIPTAGITALQVLRDKGQIAEGSQVLINGASGGVGTFAVQLAKFYGAEVTAVCSTHKVDLVTSLGADHVIDYKKEDFVDCGRTFDIVFAVSGNRSLRDYQKVMKPNARYVMAGGSDRQFYEVIALGGLKSRDGRIFSNYSIVESPSDLAYMADLIAGGKISPVIERRYPFDQLPDAVRYLDKGHAAGKIVVEMPVD